MPTTTRPPLLRSTWLQLGLKFPQNRIFFRSLRMLNLRTDIPIEKVTFVQRLHIRIEFILSVPHTKAFLTMINISGCVQSTSQYIPAQTSTAHYSQVQSSRVPYSPIQTSTAQYSLLQPSTANYSPVQSITDQHSPVQVSTLQYGPVLNHLDHPSHNFLQKNCCCPIFLFRNRIVY